MHSGGSGGRNELPETAAAIRKGPWTAEEDEVLADYVKKHGPRDWSSIRSKGLLHRTGKSCRLRWVNKLRPGLKSGCKFNSDEERTVIDMQARFGNKWARIATFLPGRTDNDVKNFWSTRQKRLARLLQTPLPVRSEGTQKKAPVSSQVPDSEDVLLQNVNSPSIDLIQFAEYFSKLPETATATATATAPIRKGSWTAEEDEVLMDYVKKHGPRDWSSIRSKGLLPRIGKSCRLRWVNKLRPNLKSGCKFNQDEERTVIDMQARFGNKWARIATFLPGRTDNDVKNFWSTRQKRLTRLLQTPHPIRSQRRQKNSPVSSQVSDFEGVLLQNVNSPSLDLIQFAEYYSNDQCNYAAYVEDLDSPKTMEMLNLDATTTLLEPTIINNKICLQSRNPPQLSFDHSLLDLHIFQEEQDLIPEFDKISFPDHFICEENFHAMELPAAQPTFFDLDVGGHDKKIEHLGTLESFLNDFPTDMLDCLDQPPA
ncbi:hypothetical protein IEQ34_012480 [Dendrobium chrysotoxum]|uniref:Uncharacterized protein n=1 Tax=Dendrobium chrysotoxum TaxID=161865 RepID=A0AAV7GUJ4_DENCH|nr:hypothetical protein IEQ34_012480 [Dendrobium chrysotoxum]